MGALVHQTAQIEPGAVLCEGARVWRQGHVRRGALIGANSTIVCGIAVGENALVGTGSVVTRDVAGHQLVHRNPARVCGRVCRRGAVVSRAESGPEELTCQECLADRTESAFR